MPRQCRHALLLVRLIQIPYLHGIVIRAETSRPSVNAVTDLTQSLCPFSVATHCCSSGLLRSHTFTVLSTEQEASRLSVNAVTDHAQSLCPFSVATHCCSSGLLRSHTFMVLSSEQEASRPSANAVTDTTMSVCPFSVATHSCSSACSDPTPLQYGQQSPKLAAHRSIL